MSANIALLDRALALYGPETKEIRAMLRGAVVRILDQMWSKDGPGFLSGANRCRRRNSLRKNPGTLAEERHATLASGPGVEYRGGYRENALVNVRTTSHLGFHAVAGGAGSLAHRSFSSVSASSPLSTRPWSPACSSPRCRFPAQSFLILEMYTPYSWSDCSSPAPRCAPPLRSSDNRNEGRVPRGECRGEMHAFRCPAESRSQSLRESFAFSSKRFFQSPCTIVQWILTYQIIDRTTSTKFIAPEGSTSIGPSSNKG